MSIIVENLTKKYGPQRAIDNISFTIETGKIIGFIGPNGAGKSTTMKIISCYLNPTHGTVKLGNLNIKDHPEQIKRKIGYLPESNALYGEMPIIDYLKFSAAIQGVKKYMILDRVKEMVEMCGLTPEKHKKISELSKGYKQRVGLAQAMIHDPEVLILDEPTSGLDPNQIIEIRKLIKRLGEEKTLILSSHILSEVEATCDRLLFINKGKIIADDTSEDLRKKLQNNKEVIAIQIECEENDKKIQEILLNLPEVEKVETSSDSKKGSFKVISKPDLSCRKAVSRLCASKEWDLIGISKLEIKLEDVFITLTK